jgi:hypothetical protein
MKSKNRKRIYRKKKRTYKLRGGTYLRNNLNNKPTILHPLNSFVQKKIGDNYAILLNKDNIDQLNYEDIYTGAFFQKYLEILNYSFEKEREYAISRGSYSPGYKHNISSIQSNIHNPRFLTYILASSNLTPISFLYVEQNSEDYDKVWTVCTDPDYRGKGLSSHILKHMILEQLNQEREKMLLEVFEDQVISREENDVKQSQIMAHFSKNGFVHTPLEKLERHTFNNLLSNTGNTKIMIFNPQKWYQNNKEENRNLNSKAKQICQN